MQATQSPGAGPSQPTLADLGVGQNSQADVVEEDEATDLDESADEEVDDEDYETTRLRRIEENRILLGELGISTMVEDRASFSAVVESQPKAKKKTKDRQKGHNIDRYGHIISKPRPGETFKMACVMLPSDRKVRRRIADGEYHDCSSWGEGEERRWHFGDGVNEYQEGEAVLVGGVAPDFRWRRWLGTQKELRRELVQRGEMNDMDMRVTRSTAEEGVSDYSLIPGQSCHQCRRKSEKEKMRCRNTNPPCKAQFCETCCKRYNYFDFDPDARSFICPLCRNCCNCSNCIRKTALAHLLDPEGLKRAKSLRFKMKKDGGGDGTIQGYLEQAAGLDAPLKTPFDRVRIVTQAEDVISPDLPPEEPEAVAVVKVPKKRKSQSGDKASGPSKKQKKGKKAEDGSASPSKKVPATEALKLKFARPGPIKSTSPVKQHATPRRTKEVDSDGDTVGEWSENELVNDQASLGSQSQLTSLSSRSPTPPRRLAFPPRQSAENLPPTLHAIAAEGFMNPAMMHGTVAPLNIVSAPTPGIVATDDLGPEPLRQPSAQPEAGSSSTDPTASMPAADTLLDNSSPMHDHDEYDSDDPLDLLPRHYDTQQSHKSLLPSYHPGIRKGGSAAMLSADPPPYSHSPPRGTPATLPQPRPAASLPNGEFGFFPPAPMSNSLGRYQSSTQIDTVDHED